MWRRFSGCLHLSACAWRSRWATRTSRTSRGRGDWIGRAPFASCARSGARDGAFRAASRSSRMPILRDVIKVLDSAGIRSAVIGAAAMSLHGIARSTFARDLLVSDRVSSSSSKSSLVAHLGHSLSSRTRRLRSRALCYDRCLPNPHRKDSVWPIHSPSSGRARAISRC